MNYKERLKEYLEVDTLYQNYKKGIEEEKSDFDLFCVQHCLDVENLLNEVEELHNKIDKAIEYLVNPVEKIWEGHSIDEVVRILKGDVDE